MAIITIDTVPVSDFFVRWINAIGSEGFMIIFFSLFIFLIITMTQEMRKSQQNNHRHKLWRFWSKKQEENDKIENPEEFKKETERLSKWKSKMERRYGSFTYY